jgi:FkbM family methyltransferase
VSDPTPSDLSDYLAKKTPPELELARLFRRSAPLVIFDIGACEGEDSIRYSRAFPNARVYAFEPLPQNHPLIRSNLARYRASSVELIPIALSDRTGTATFHVSSGRPSEEFSGKSWNYGNKSSSLLPPAGQGPMYGWIEFKESMSVPTGTLDSFCAERGIEAIEFIHMDVQGAEHLVLSGGSAALARTTALWFEVSEQRVYQGQKLRAEMEQLMRERGFVLGFQAFHGVEGDQFYINRRAREARRYLAGRLVREKLGGLVRLARRLKSAVSR